MTTGRVGVVGASARAAVMSLARAGYSAWAVDLFADRDLRRIAECVRCPLAEYPAAIPALAERFPPGPFLYTGGLENAPDVINVLAEKRPLWGNGSDVLRLVRDPFFVAKLLVDSPRLEPEQSLVPAEGRWLVKSLGSSGGLGVRSSCAGECVPSGCYIQEFVPGPALSAVFNGPQLLGITEQLIGQRWLHTNAFHYAGTIGPIDLPSQGIHKLADAAQQLVLECGMQGIFGIDFIWNQDRPWIVEINPRYPASLEVLEHSASRERKRPQSRTIGKAIYFAAHALRFPEHGPWDADLSGPFDSWRLPEFADIPAPGEAIEAGSPVLTFFTSAPSAEECRRRLQSRAAELDRLFAPGAKS